MPANQLESLATGRTQSLFEEDLRRNESELRERFAGKRVAVIGAAGSIGFAVLKSLLRYSPGTVSLIDLSENNLVEVVRDLRASPDLEVPRDFESLPIGLGSIEFSRYFRESKPFDFIFNLSAVKHVRSEKNVYTLIRMLDTNVLFLADFLRELPYRPEKFFSVSSDKAVNPANMMGASKLAMERVLSTYSGTRPYSTARFANVAFSDGSLPYGFLKRLDKLQPISAPRDVKRYFISHEEAGQLCVLSAGLGANREVFFPKLHEGLNELRFDEIAVRVLRTRGYEPFECATDEEAKRRLPELVKRGKWPCVFGISDTSGEKPFEEFYSTDDRVDLERFRSVGVVVEPEGGAKDVQLIENFLSFLRKAKSDPSVGKDAYVRELAKVVPSFAHVETGKNLDQKM